MINSKLRAVIAGVAFVAAAPMVALAMDDSMSASGTPGTSVMSAMHATMAMKMTGNNDTDFAKAAPMLHTSMMRIASIEAKNGKNAKEKAAAQKILQSEQALDQLISDLKNTSP